MSRSLAVLLLAGLALLGCQQEVSEASPEAEIEAAINAHVANKSQLDLANMEIEVQEVDVQGDMARALILFRTKGGEAEMPVRYSLAREDGSWVVQDKGPRRVHGQPLPQGHPPVETPEREAPQQP
jgi:hypothetical protein